MLNVNKVTSELSMMPDPALQQFASLHKDDPYMLSLAVAESNRRKDMRMAPQMAAQQQPKVADQAIAGMAPLPAPTSGPEGTGIGRLPAQNMQRMAGGGIVAFADGGDTAQDDSVPWYMRPAGETIPNIPEYIGERMGAYRRWQQENLRRAGIPQDKAVTRALALGPYPAETRTPQELERYVKEAPPEAQAPVQQPLPSDVDAGLALYNRIRGGASIPQVSTGYKAEPYEEAARKVEAAAAGRQKETEAAFAPYFKKLAGEEEAIGKRDNVKEALIRAGLGMMGGTSPFAMVNIGKGGIEGLDAYQKAQAMDQAAKQHNMQSQVALMQAQRAERSGNLRDATSLYAQSRQDANTAAQLDLQAKGMNQRAAEMQQEMRLRAIVAKQPPAIMQIADRIRAENPGMKFSEALQQAYGMQAAPRSEADLRKAWSSSIMLQQQFPNFADYAAAVGATIGGTAAPSSAGWGQAVAK